MPLLQLPPSSLLLLLLLSLPLLWAQLADPVAFTAIKGSVNGNYIAFQAVIVNSNVSSLSLAPLESQD